jgi:hypothetical protein
MNANLFEQQRNAELSRAMKDYENAKQNYQRLVRQAVSEPDSTKRTEYLQAAEAENARLVKVVEGIIQVLSEGDSQGKMYPASSVDDLNDDLESYQSDLEFMRNSNDKIVQLRELLSTLTNESSNDRKQYYGYIVGILVLLIIVFVFFVYSYAASVINAVTETVTSVTAPVTESLTE